MEIETQTVEFISFENNSYVRYGPESWHMFVGESSFAIYGPEELRLETEYQRINNFVESNK